MLSVDVLFIWASFIEPKIIITRKETIDVGFSAKIALISDIHLGMYKDADFLKRVVAIINKQNPDYIIIAGDFTLAPNIDTLNTLFKNLSDIQAPIYGVLGNHDVERPGPNIRKELLASLTKNKVHVLNNEAVKLGSFTLIGLGDRWSEEDDTTLLDTYNESDNIIVIAHNPDTTLDYKNNNADVTLSGHTHCGQIRIPWLHKKMIPTLGNFNKGLTQEIHTQLYISCGLGESWPPMRLFNPPSIDILNLQ